MHGNRTATIRIRPKLGALAVCLADRPAARRWLSLVWLAALLLGLVGCWRAPESEVVAYTALDQEFSGPIYARFTRITGIEVAAKYDVESTKTLGLVEAILAERQRPRADLFWNNEILHTLRLERAGLLAAFTPPNAASFPAQFRSTAGRWYGMAARARVLEVRHELWEPRFTGFDDQTLLYDLKLNNRIAALQGYVQGADRAPTDQVLAVSAELSKAFDESAGAWTRILDVDLPAFNSLLRARGRPVVERPQGR